MHFVTGGAFNGKKEWVKNYYQSRYSNSFPIFSAYKEPITLSDVNQTNNEVIIIEGLEQWVKTELDERSPDQTRAFFKDEIRRWISWEKQHPNRKFILIGTDITKGIVPMAMEDRLWRDVTGWVFQDAVKQADRVDVVWYGLNQRLK